MKEKMLERATEISKKLQTFHNRQKFKLFQKNSCPYSLIAISILCIAGILIFSPDGNTSQRFHEKLKKKKQEEIKIIDDYSVEVRLGSDGKTVSSVALDAIRSIPSVRTGKEPEVAYVNGVEIFKQKNGLYSWDKNGENVVKLTSKRVKNSGGALTVSLIDRPSSISKPSPPDLNTASSSDAGGIAEVKGFRAARFGMTESEVRKVIEKDFNVAQGKIGSGENKIENTKFMNIAVNNLLPGSGPAQIVYIFGYKSKRLIQVNVVWGGSAKPDSDIKSLISTANLLRNYFVRLGFPKDKMVVNSKMEDGSIVVFRAFDRRSRLINLVLNKPQGNQTASPGEETSLKLFYIENPGSPDIFTIETGLF